MNNPKRKSKTLDQLPTHVPSSKYNRPSVEIDPYELVKNEPIDDIHRVYKFGKTLGTGKFGIVKKGASVLDPKHEFAIKIIKKSTINRNLELFRREINLLKTLDDPNIVKFYETYQDDENFYIVMEYCSGGTLIDYLIGLKDYSEEILA